MRLVEFLFYLREHIHTGGHDLMEEGIVTYLAVLSIVIMYIPIKLYSE